MKNFLVRPGARDGIGQKRCVFKRGVTQSDFIMRKRKWHANLLASVWGTNEYVVSQAFEDQFGTLTATVSIQHQKHAYNGATLQSCTRVKESTRLWEQIWRRTLSSARSGERIPKKKHIL